MYLTQGLHRSLRTNPHAVAVTGERGSVTFADLADRVSRLASGLLGLGLRSGDRVGILSANSSEYLEVALACPWAELVLTPVNSRWSPAEIAYQIDDADVSVLIVDSDSVGAGGALRDRCPVLTTLVSTGDPAPGLVGYEDLIDCSAPMEDRRLSGDALAAILYTGGTTGEPKGVMISPGQLITSAVGTLATMAAERGPNRFLHTSPLYHLAALASFYQQVTLGSHHFTVPEYDTASVAELIERERITGTTLVPVMIQRLVAHSGATGCDLSSLRLLGYGASPISESTLRALLDLLPEVQLCQRYGMTELGPVATVLTPGDHRDPSRPHLLRSAGRAALHAEVRVVDGEDRELPTGQVGEVVVRGGHLMIGYWKKPEQTAETLRGGWMHTGDAGYFDDEGYLYLVDRFKDMIVTGGENVYSAEVERVLEQHPRVSACAVIGVPDPDWGERVHAVVVLGPGKVPEPTVREIRAFCAERIARYKAPHTVDFVPQLPLSAVGKVLKRTLREQYAAPGQ
ncbi:long-chain-fatty-acid--CoA ligase [Streptomyces sp. NBC_00656]|uniref:long-chain-fatty-acid--CoA ligase n=1 Tax=Streptomyces sp. NBC_00656 TaxID=2903668 RepID=UPI0032502959